MDNAVKFKTGFNGYVRKDVDAYIDALVDDHDKQVIEMKKRLEEAMRVVDEKNVRASELESRNIELRAQIDTLESQTGHDPQADAEIARLSDLLDRRTAELEALQSLRDASQQELETLRAQNGDADAVRREFEALVRDRDEQLEALRQQAQSGGDTSALQEQLAQRDSDITLLKQQLEAMQEQGSDTAALSAQLTQRDSDITSLKTQIETLQRQLDAGDGEPDPALAQTLHERESELQTLKGDIAQKVIEVEELKSQMEELKRQLDATGGTTVALEQLRADREQMQAALDLALKEKEAAIALRDARIDEIQRQLDSRPAAAESPAAASDEVRGLYRKLDDAQRAVADSVVRLEQKDRELDNLRERLVQHAQGTTAPVSDGGIADIYATLTRQSDEIAALRDELRRSREPAAVDAAPEQPFRPAVWDEPEPRPPLHIVGAAPSANAQDGVLTAQAIEQAGRIVTKAREDAANIRSSIERNYESAYREIKTISDCIENVNRLFSETARRIDGILDNIRKSEHSVYQMLHDDQLS